MTRGTDKLKRYSWEPTKISRTYDCEQSLWGRPNNPPFSVADCFASHELPSPVPGSFYGDSVNPLCVCFAVYSSRDDWGVYSLRDEPY